MRWSRLEMKIDREEWFQSQQEAVQVFQRTRMHTAPQETFWCLAYGIDLGIATMFEVNRGQYATVELHIPSLLSGVLASGVERFTLAHNHPSNDPNPTGEDIALTRNVMRAANAVRLIFEDHLILARDDSYFSFASGGLLIPSKDSPYAVRAAARKR